MVYGRGTLMVEAARWLARRRLLAVWRQPTWIQLISTIDFLRATQAAILQPDVRGIYHLGDDEPVTLQNFLDRACRHWGHRRPLRLPVGLIYTAAWVTVGHSARMDRAQRIDRIRQLARMTHEHFQWKKLLFLERPACTEGHGSLG